MASSWILRGALLAGLLLPVAAAVAQPAPTGAPAAAASAPGTSAVPPPVSGSGNVAAAPPSSAGAPAAAASPAPAPVCQMVEDLCPTAPKEKCILLRCSLPFGPASQGAALLPVAPGSSSAVAGVEKAPQPAPRFADHTSGVPPSVEANLLLAATRAAARAPSSPIVGLLQGEEERSNPLAFLHGPVTAALPALDKKTFPGDATGQSTLEERMVALLETATPGAARGDLTGQSKHGALPDALIRTMAPGTAFGELTERPKRGALPNALIRTVAAGELAEKLKLGFWSRDSVMHTDPRDPIRVNNHIVEDVQMPPVKGALAELDGAGVAGAGQKPEETPVSCRGNTWLDVLCACLYRRLGQLGLQLTPSGPRMEQSKGSYQIFLPATKTVTLAKGSEPLDLRVGVQIVPGYLIHYAGCPDAKCKGPQKPEYDKVMEQLNTSVRDLLIVWLKVLYPVPASGQ